MFVPMQNKIPEFLKRIKIHASGCWLWYNKDFSELRAYGGIVVNGERLRAHVLSYRIYIGDIAPKLCICHKCDNPYCVNPFHLFIGTTKENLQDMSRKGRKLKLRHGKFAMYAKGCRCSLCIQANEDYQDYLEDTRKVLNLKKK